MVSHDFAPCENLCVSYGTRLTALDHSFLQLEGEATHMHVGACAVFDGPAPAYGELIAAIEGRLHLLPRYRQRLAPVPLGQGRPVWVDDPQFRLPFHVRHTALPRPGSDTQLRRLAGRIFSQGLDRGRPLWEMWLIEGLSHGRFALLSKTHHALVDGVAGIDIASVLFDTDPDARPEPARPGRRDRSRPRHSCWPTPSPSAPPGRPRRWRRWTRSPAGRDGC